MGCSAKPRRAGVRKTINVSDGIKVGGKLTVMHDTVSHPRPHQDVLPDHRRPMLSLVHLWSYQNV
jgi:hypothetical protein